MNRRRLDAARNTRWPVTGPERRRGFTLVELIVSVLVLAVGLLALTGASAVVARQIGGGAQLVLAATVAQSRFEILRGRPCEAASDGVSARDGIVETWSATRIGNVVEVTDTIVISSRNGSHVHAFRSSIPCPERP